MNKANEIKYWNDYYKNDSGRTLRYIPSQFAVFVASEIGCENYNIVEIGCGNGRDSLFFDRHNFNVVAVDQSESAIELCKSYSGNSVNFLCASVDSDDLVQNVNNLVSQFDCDKKVCVYGRFFIHALSDEDNVCFLEKSKKIIECNSGGYLSLEFRTKNDLFGHKLTKHHYRRYINFSDFVEKCEDIGYSVEYAIEGQGMAKYKEDDAYVGRCILSV